MYFATDKDGNRYYADYTGNHTNEELKAALYCDSECGSVNDEPQTFEDIKQLFKDLKKEERNGGFDKGEFTNYKSVYDFIRDSFEIITVLVPLKDSDLVMDTMTTICKRKGWKDKDDFSPCQMREELTKELILFVPKFLWNDYNCSTLTEMIEDYFNPDYGRSQELY